MASVCNGTRKLQVDIFPADPPREGEDYIEEYGVADSNDLLDRVIELPDGRQIALETYKSEAQLEEIMGLIGRELSEPYSIYTYRYFIHYWPRLCILARDIANNKIAGVIICKLEHQQMEDADFLFGQGYIAMLAVEQSYRGMGLGTKLVRTVVRVMQEKECDEVVLETEVSNASALSLYGHLGFIRESRLFRYYLNGSDAFRLKLYLERPNRPKPEQSIISNRNLITANLVEAIINSSTAIGKCDGHECENHHHNNDGPNDNEATTKGAPEPASSSSTHL